MIVNYKFQAIKRSCKMKRAYSFLIDGEKFIWKKA